MKFEWDETKRLKNIRKHDFDFIDASIVFKDYTITIEDNRFDYGEQRFITLGILQKCVVVIVHTQNAKTNSASYQ